MTEQVILSIQSAVMHGAVGNDAAMPVYQHLQQPAARLDTVRLAAHPGFGTTAVSVTPAGELDTLLRDYRCLAAFEAVAAVQTGYFGHPGQIDPVARFISTSRTDHRHLVFLLDPVLGDGGQFYVDKTILTEMRDRLLPLADIITPNQFELGLLAGTVIGDETDAIDAARRLLGGRLQSVIVTGVTTAAGHIADIAVSPGAEKLITTEKQATGVSGSGDVFSALFLSAYLSGLPAEKAAEVASQKTAQMIRRAETRLTMPVLNSIWADVI